MTKKIEMINGKRFYNMGNRGLEHDVCCGKNKTIVIPAGTKRVKIAFRQSHLTRWDDEAQAWVRMNVYLYKGVMYHA